jgi:hypothetical protein
MTPYEKLQSLYCSYGYHESINTYFASLDSDLIKDFFTASESVRKLMILYSAGSGSFVGGM